MSLPCIRHGHALGIGRSRTVRWIGIVLLSGIILSAMPPVTVLAQDALLAGRTTSDPHAVHVAEAAQRFGIPGYWIRAVMRFESAGDTGAISSAGAMGLMQVMPETWAGLRARYRFGDDPFDARDNILAGAAYLREMLDRYGNTGGMLAAYNAGPGRYDEYLSAGRALPAETRAYVAVLTPVLGGDPLPEGGITAHVPSSDWREASLFIAQPGPGAATDLAPPGEHSDDRPKVVSARDISAIVPQSGDLFGIGADSGVTR